MKTDRKDLKLTKELQKRLAYWQVGIRKENTDVEHLTYRSTASIPPIAFACFEGCMRAIYSHWCLIPNDLPKPENVIYLGPQDKAETLSWYKKIAYKNGFTLFVPDGISCDEAMRHYQWFAAKIGDAGFYMELLD